MGLMDRLRLVFGAKAKAALDKLEDPRESLEYSYQRQLDLLQKVRHGVAEVATGRRRLELQADQLEDQVTRYTDAASRALELNREDLAREALSRKAGLLAQLADLRSQHAQLSAEEEKLARAHQRLQARVDAFRMRRETLKATYTAAKAQATVQDALSGLGEEMGDIGSAVQRIEDRTQALRARASAVDELLASGALNDPLAGTGDDITRELDALASDSEVEEELRALKRRAALEPGAPGRQAPPAGPPEGEWRQPGASTRPGNPA